MSKKSKIILTVFIVFALLLGGIAGAIVYYPHHVANKFERVDAGIKPKPSQSAAPDNKPKPLNILVLGSDSRISAGDPGAWKAGAQRTDAMMVVQLSGDRTGINIMSIPRDSWVNVPGHGDDKINSSFSAGGPKLAVKTVQQLTGIEFDHFMLVDFESFAKLTDSLGGVKFGPSGKAKNMNGHEALRFVRERKTLPSGDLDRVRRQQAWMRAIMAKLFSGSVLSNPVKLNEVINIVASTTAVDENLTASQMRTIALSARNIRPRGVTFFTAPVSGVGWSPDGKQSIVNLNKPKMAKISQAFVDDRVKQLLQEDPTLVQRLDKGRIY